MAGSMTRKIAIDGREFPFEGDKIQGAQIRALGVVKEGYDLIVEGEGDRPDLKLEDNEFIVLSDRGIKVFTKPPTTFGM